MRRPEEALMTDASARPTPAKFAAWLCLGLFVLGIDQATKIWFEQNFSLGEVLPVCTGFNLVLAHNTGAAFSFLADAGGWQRWAFAARPSFRSALVAVRPERPQAPVQCWP